MVIGKQQFLLAGALAASVLAWFAVFRGDSDGSVAVADEVRDAIREELKGQALCGICPNPLPEAHAFGDISLEGRADASASSVVACTAAITCLCTPVSDEPYAGPTKEVALGADDTLEALARAYGISVRRLAELNEISLDAPEGDGAAEAEEESPRRRKAARRPAAADARLAGLRTLKVPAQVVLAPKTRRSVLLREYMVDKGKAVCTNPRLGWKFPPAE